MKQTKEPSVPHATMPQKTDNENDHRKTTFQKAKEVEVAMVEVPAVAASVGEKAARAVVAKAGRRERTAEPEEPPSRKEVQTGDNSTRGQRRKSALPTSRCESPSWTAPRMHGRRSQRCA